MIQILHFTPVGRPEYFMVLFPAVVRDGRKYVITDDALQAIDMQRNGF